MNTKYKIICLKLDKLYINKREEYYFLVNINFQNKDYKYEIFYKDLWSYIAKHKPSMYQYFIALNKSHTDATFTPAQMVYYSLQEEFNWQQVIQDYCMLQNNIKRIGQYINLVNCQRKMLKRCGIYK